MVKKILMLNKSINIGNCHKLIEYLKQGSKAPYVKQCYEGDLQLIKCFKDALHHLTPYLAEGIPEIELPSVEPFRMDELSLSLTTGPNGYKVSLLDIDIFGASNFSVKKLRLSEKDRPFETRIHIPKLKINSRYKSSGVLIILPASGNGTLNGLFEDLTAIVRGTASISEKEGVKYLHIDTLNVDIEIKNVKMVVKDIYRNNSILTQAINLFLRDNGQEILRIMLPQLRMKLATLFMDISNKLLSHLPLDVFYVPLSKQKKT
ncbi:uncharacterized protein LOC123678759 isoform X1 [Harmonia axyridis]|uniref:uncharacterized protein LOC123678759 isoform X1 n=1 Tax=Harmonia axyridis TaxID=115357 RepID=UPI001E277061|nr:uncharacterized protein LOC123678759 isoform X1 [Harmonia axyridis]